MSHVTAVVLMFSVHEEDALGVPPPSVAALQTWLRQADVGQLVSVDQLFGGGKHPGVVCMGGGFNHLDAADFVAVFHQQEWRHPEQVVLTLTIEDEPTIVIRPREDG